MLEADNELDIKVILHKFCESSLASPPSTLPSTKPFSVSFPIELRLAMVSLSAKTEHESSLVYTWEAT